MMHALIRDGQIIEAGALPLPAWYDGTRWWDTRDPSQVALAGWLEVVEESRPADTATTTWDRDEPRLIEGVPTVGWTERDKTVEEIAAEFEQNARLDDHETRIARIEAHLWPAPPEPTQPTDAPEWADLPEPDRWPNGSLLLDTDGKVYRNISGSILTTPPSGFPGGGVAWLGNLFVVALAPEPEPDPDPDPEPTGYPAWKPWDGNNANLYQIPNRVSHKGRNWEANVGNNHWEPGVFGWTDLGPVT